MPAISTADIPSTAFCQKHVTFPRESQEGQSRLHFSEQQWKRRKLCQGALLRWLRLLEKPYNTCVSPFKVSPLSELHHLLILIPKFGTSVVDTLVYAQLNAFPTP